MHIAQRMRPSETRLHRMFTHYHACMFQLSAYIMIPCNCELLISFFAKLLNKHIEDSRRATRGGAMGARPPPSLIKGGHAPPLRSPPCFAI